MKKYFLSLVLLTLTFQVFSQKIGDYAFELQELTFPDIPGLQSFVFGTSGDQWLVIGGRTDGLHRRQPWATFWEEDNNQQLFVIDPIAKQVWTSPLSQLPTTLFEQLQSTNMEFHQQGNMLYIIGGYGYSASAGDHITFPYLTAVDIEATIQAIKNNEPPTIYFRQIESENFRVTGGQLGVMDNRFYLVGGQKFMGRYNPHGPDHGPGFEQEYTNQIRSFTIVDDGQTLDIQNYQVVTDTAELHRRDYNMVGQVFPDGSNGYTIFSGVFRYDNDLPWLNTVDLSTKGYAAVPNFKQLLNQYHTAQLGAYDGNSNAMHTVFFGGISQYYFNDQNVLMDDPNVPFVNTISRVSRDQNGIMSEAKIGEMPDLLGASAEFIPAPDLQYNEVGVLNLDQLPKEKTLIGYVFGGIKSSAANIFFVNDGTQSEASNRIYAVYLSEEESVANKEINKWHESVRIFPNPTESNHFTLSFDLLKTRSLTIDLLDNKGKVIQIFSTNKSYDSDRHQFDLEVKDVPKGTYLIRIYDDESVFSQKLILK